MKKTLKLSLFFSVSIISIAFANELSNTYTLDEAKTQEYELKNKLIENSDVKVVENNQEQPIDDKNLVPNIIKEEIEGGYVEKLVDENNLVIAEKTIINGEITKKVLYYYHPNKQISKKILASNNDSGFYAEEFYTNGNISSKVSYLNDENKIGKEKKYDINGVLRQEIPWEIIKEDENKPFSERRSIRKGKVLTYYPNGKKAASFSVGYAGDNVFYNQKGQEIKIIKNKEILDFSDKNHISNCGDITIQLSLEELVSLYEDEGDISYNNCGIPYKELFINEVVDVNNKLSTVISYDETGMVRKIVPYNRGLKNGKVEKFDANGNLTAQINYEKGVKQGYAIGYFPTKEIAFKKYYENNKVVDKLNCYFPNGEIAASISYKDGLKDGVANITSPTPQEITYKNGEIVRDNTSNKRKILSLNSMLAKVDSKCLDISSKIKEIEQDIKSKENNISEALSVKAPEGCEDLSKYVAKQSKYWCFIDNVVKGSYDPSYNKGEYSVVTYYGDAKNKEYDVGYLNKKLQGITKKYDTKGNTIAEMSYNQGELSDNSRSYNDNGSVENIISVYDNQKLYNSYSDDGMLLFSNTYDNDVLAHSFISNPAKNKDTYVKYYQGKLDNIKEVNAKNPSNYVEYNLALGEYSIYKDKNLIRGGNICGYEKISDDIEVIKAVPAPTNVVLEETKKEETILPSNNVEQINNENKELIESLKKLDEEIKAIAKESEDKNIVKEIDENKLNIDNVVPSNVDVDVKKDIANLEANINQIKEVVNATQEVSEIELHINDDNAIPPVIDPKDAPIIEGIETLEELEIQQKTSEYKLDDKMIKVKTKTDLASQNIGPVSHPAISSLSDTVSKSKVDVEETKSFDNADEKIEKIYYPNNKLRKTIKTIGSRTKEVKEYSKTGLLLKDTIYNDDDIIIEKYSGSGDISRKTRKNYSDNVIDAFISRVDFYNTGKPRYKVSKVNNILLFNENSYYTNGELKEEVFQNSPLVFTTISYDKNGQKQREQVLYGMNVFDIAYKDNNVIFVKINNDELPSSYANNKDSILKDSSKAYNQNKELVGEFNVNDKQTTIIEYDQDNKIKSEIVLFNNGEITLKTYIKEQELDKFAYLTSDGKLYIQKPEVRVIPNYRERYWVDYNNPNWVENTDKYSIKSIGKLNLDIIAYMLTELKIETPEIIKQLYSKY